MTAEEFANAYKTGLRLTERLLISRGLSQEEAYETAQAAWVKGWERREQLRNPSVVLTWVNTIAINTYRSSLRGLPHFEEVHELPGARHENGASIDVRTLLATCKPNDRRILEQHYLEGLKINEIAALNGWTETAVRIRLLRARRSIRTRAESKKLPKYLFRYGKDACQGLARKPASVRKAAPATGTAVRSAGRPARVLRPVA
jgi:RNA polymerase sigma factor (sigma-70 family)